MRICPFNEKVKCDNPNAWKGDKIGLEHCVECKVFMEAHQQILIPHDKCEALPLLEYWRK